MTPSPGDQSLDRSQLELPPLRARLADAWPFMGAFVVVMFAPFLFFPIGDVLIGWPVGAALYGLVRLLARRSLYDFLTRRPEFGLDANDRVHVLSHQREAFTPVEWSPGKESREHWLGVTKGLVFVVVVSLGSSIAMDLWDREIATSAWAGFILTLSIAEPLQQVRGRRAFRQTPGGVVLDPVVFGPFFSTYVASDRFDPNDRTPHIDKVLEAGLGHLDPAQRHEMLVETKRKMIDRAHAGLAAGSLAKILRMFGG